MTAKALLRQLASQGAMPVRQRGSHVRVEIRGCVTTVPVRRAEVTNVATLTAAIRANYSAVINGLGGVAHTHAVGDDLRRVARLLDADRAHRYDAVGDAVRTLGARTDATHDDCVGILSDLTVTTAVTELLGLLD